MTPPITFTPRPEATPDQLRAIAHAASTAADAYDDDDYRAYFLAALETLDWAATDDRWRAAMDMLRHDQPLRRDPISSELERLLMNIAVQGGDMITLRGEYADRADLQETSRKLRAAADRLCSILYAVTAVHTLGEVAS